MKKSVVLSIFVATMCCSFQVKAENTIMLAGANWEPYMGEELPGKGFLVELSTEALKRVGYDVDIVFVPWARAVEMTKEGKYTALVGASFNQERSEFLSYPNSSWEVKMSFFSLPGKQIQYTTLENLCPVRIGLIRGSYLYDRLHEVDCITLDIGATVLKNIRKLLAGRFDVYLESQDNVAYYVNNYLSDKKEAIELISPPFEVDNIYTAFSKNIPEYEQLTKDFDRGIQLIQADGVYDSILKKHGMYAPTQD